MRPTKNELVLRRCTKFTKTDINSSSIFKEISENSDSIGGVIRRGQLGWLSRGPLLEVFSLRNGNKISSFRFDLISSFQRCFITCVSEIDVPGLKYCLLAVGVQFGDDPGGMLSIYSVQESKVLRSIETADKVTCCHVVSTAIVDRTILEMFQGCLAIGTDSGKVILLDLYLSKCEKALVELKSRDDELNLVPCHVVLSTMDSDHIRQHFRHSRKDNVNFGIQLEVMEDADLVLSILSLTPLLALAAGLEDGRMILYDLTDLQAFHLAYPPEDMSPLVKMCFVEPPDDPRACIYIWAFHENRKSSIAVLHSVMYDRKTVDDDDDDDKESNFNIFEGFQSCSVRLTLPIFERGSIPVGCQSVSHQPAHDDEEAITLCLLAWRTAKSTELLIFDINQWYKEQMPNVGDWRDNLSYLASFPLRESSTTLDVWLDSRTITPFNSIQRPEEHFFPISLSFDCTVLQETECLQLHWPGLQNRALEILNSGGPAALLEPSVYYHEVMRASLVPQSSELTFGSTMSLTAQRDVLLSVALEYNCFGLLKECARCWADGSHLGRKPDESLSLSTLTNWIWKRAETIKERCNVLCIPLFDHSGLRIDQRSKKELSYCSRQLKLLADLMNLILNKCRQYIPEDVNRTLTTQHNSIKMASEYQEVLQWFLNIGLLPEAATNPGEGSSFLDNYYDTQSPLVPYPYKVLCNYYASQRAKFKKINSGLLSARTQSCRILFIDSFIERECNANVLREHWQESGGNGLYPPASLQAMLRIMLIPNVPVENKFALLIYLFLDLTMALEDERYAGVVQNLAKFPSVFAMNASTVKIVQAFWNLDHGQFEASLDDIISPFLNDRKLIQWQKELLIEALLIHHVPKFALRALQAPGPPISSLLELKTLLANDLVADAFHLQRSKNDADLFRNFLTGCLYLGKMGSLLDLALSEQENEILEDFLRERKSSKTENLHFVHLLQRSKYIEAVEQLDELSCSRHNQRSVDLETPNLVLAAYNTTMTPSTKHLSEVYYGIRHRLRAKVPEAQALNTLSSELLKYNADEIAGGVYQSSIMSIDEATNYWDESLQRERTRLLNSSNVPFIRRPQLEIFAGYHNASTISYPEVYKDSQKRRLETSEASGSCEHLETDFKENPKKRQRINDSLSGYKVSEPLNASLLTRFKGRLQMTEKPQQPDDSTTNNQSRLEGNKSVSSLSTPIVKSSRTLDRHDDILPERSVLNRPDRLSTPHSILKVPGAVSSPFKKQVEMTPRRSISPVDSELNDEKLIRFNLRSKSITPEQSSREMSHSRSISPAKVESGSSPRRIYGPKARRAIRSSDRSLLSTSGEEDEFYSPQTSRDNSIKQNEETSSSPPELEQHLKAANYIVKSHLTEGPKPRKPLSRSRSRSKTPDIILSPSRKSSRLLEKSKTELLEIKENPFEVRNKPATRPLSRLVLESNAKRASNLQSAESSIQSIDSAGIEAQSTQIFESKSFSMTSSTETRRFSDDLQVEKTSSFAETTVSSAKVFGSQPFLQDDSEVSDSFKAEWNRRGNESLMTTMDMGSFEMTMEPTNRSENLLSDSSIELSRIERRGSSENQETDEKAVNRQEVEEQKQDDINLEEEEVLIEAELGEVAEEPLKTVEKIENVQNDGTIVEIKTDEQAERIITIEVQEEYESDIEKYSSMQSEKESVDNEGLSIDEDSEGESKSSDVISISSGSSIETESLSSKSRSNTPFDRSDHRTDCSLSSSSSDIAQDEHELIYGDLDTEVISDQAISLASIQPEIHETGEELIFEITKVETLIEVEQESTAADERTANSSNDLNKAVLIETTVSSANTTKGFSDSGFGNAPTGMILNVLTGEYESIDDDETIDELNRGHLEATSTTILEALEDQGKSLTDEPIDYSTVATEESSINVLEKPIVDTTITSDVSSGIASEFTDSTLKPSERSDANDQLTEKSVNPVEESVTGSTANILDEAMIVETMVIGESLVEEDTAAESLPSSSQEHVEITSEKTTDDIRLKVSDDEEDDRVASDHEKSKSPRNKIETPVKLPVIDQFTTDSGRILRSTRRRSASFDKETKTEIFDSPIPSTRILRATSVPRIELADTPTKSKLRKRSNSTDSPATPTRILTRRRSILLDRIEEDSVLDSPRQLRKRIPSTAASTDSTEDLQKTPSRMVKRTRKASTSSVDTPDLVGTPHSASAALKAGSHVLTEDNTLTPQRVTRRSSVSRDTPKAEPPKATATPKRETKSKTTKERAKKTSAAEEEKSSSPETVPYESEELDGTETELTKINAKTIRKLFSKTKPKQVETIDDDDDESSPEKSSTSSYSTSRRMTRNQQTVLEKSAAIKKKPDALAKGVTRRRPSKMDESPIKDDDASETGSVISNRSKQSTGSTGTRRVTRSTASKGDIDDEIASVASSTKSNRSTKGKKPKAANVSKDQNLDVISEENQENIDMSTEETDDEAGSTKSASSKGRAAAKKPRSKRAVQK